jgi:dihydropteroate synthase
VGFGKSLAHTHALLGNLDRLATAGRPLLLGVSRKSFIARTLGGEVPIEQRLEGALAATAIAVLLGVRIVRTHDVASTVRAVKMAEAVRGASHLIK